MWQHDLLDLVVGDTTSESCVTKLSVAWLLSVLLLPCRLSGAADVSDSQQSASSKQRALPPVVKDESPTMGSRENLVQNGQTSVGSSAKKPRRKKKMTHGYDFESGADGKYFTIPSFISSVNKHIEGCLFPLI